jgi:uncharacterized membrane protein YeaQ/YmgE (transglycosylase-associated protein family)
MTGRRVAAVGEGEGSLRFRDGLGAERESPGGPPRRPVMGKAAPKIILSSSRDIPFDRLVLIWIIVGAIIGWLAGLLIRGGGFGFIVDALIGILGSALGGWLLPRLGVSLGRGWSGRF